jgi:hypothetical protein
VVYKRPFRLGLRFVARLLANAKKAASIPCPNSTMRSRPVSIARLRQLRRREEGQSLDLEVALDFIVVFVLEPPWIVARCVQTASATPNRPREYVPCTHSNRAGR